jgi:primosomal protein N' (replication factor Y)
VGTRNALFAPYERVGFIAVENEHGYGHIHGAKPYAHCRDVALLRAKVGGASVAIHADVPTVESRYYADRGHLRELDLRAVHAPETVVYDLRKYEFRKYPLFSDLAFHHIHAFLAKGKKVIVYWNRKGFAGALSCQRCHEMIPCESCRAYLRVDKTRNRLVCGACGKSKPMPEVCPSCGHKSMKALGVGVDRMMESLAKQFPDKVTATYSSEDDALPAQWDLLIATQVFFESSHCASADLVIAAGLDAQASMGDFDAGLQMFVQLTRLRARAKERFVLFTQDPSFEPVAALEKGEAHFYTHECRTRAEMGLPPFWNVFEITLRSVQEAHVCERAEATVRQLADACVGIAEVYGPLPGEPAFFRGQHHRRIVVKTKDTAAVRVALKSILPQARKGSVKLAVTVR